MTAVASITPDMIERAIAKDPSIAKMLDVAESYWGSFKPRPDRPESYDQQTGFVNDRSSVAWLIKGNASGGTEAAAYKTANFLLHQQRAPRKNTPFWIVSNTFEQTIQACWNEKLEGHGHIPDSEIQWDKITWHKQALGQPSAIPLKPWPGDKSRNWMIVFKSFDQGISALQAQSIGGFWISEQPPEPIFFEIFRGCRDYLYPGGQFLEFTPTDPANWPWIEKHRDHPPKDWAFYRCNTECNAALVDGFVEQFKSSMPDETMTARLTGASPVFRGAIYQTFNPAVHVIPQSQFTFPRGATHYRSFDWGASEEHPFVALWGYRDGLGDWWIYDEYWNNSQNMTMQMHGEAVIDRHEWNDFDDEYATYASSFGDPSRPDVINLFNSIGITTAPARNSVYKGIDCIRSLLKVNPLTNRPRLFICRERCPHLAEEMTMYRWKTTATTSTSNLRQVAAPVPLKRQDDAPDALRYMVYSVEAGQGTVPGSMRTEQGRSRGSVKLDRLIMSRNSGVPGLFARLQ